LLARVALERMRDPENARREFDAEFLDADTQFLASSDIEACTRSFAGDLAPCRADHAACIDPAARSNAFTLTIGRLTDAGTLEVALAREWRPAAGAPLDLRAVVADVAAEVRRYGCDSVVSDQWSGDALAALFDAHGIHLQQRSLAGAELTEAWQRLRTLLSTRAMSLPRDEQLRDDLCAVRRRVSSGGGVSYSLPSTPDGRHADYAPALLRLAVRARTLVKPDAPRRALSREEEARAIWDEHERDIAREEWA